MNEITILHNPRCSKSRRTLELLKEQGIEPNIRLYLKDSLSAKEIIQLLEKLQMKSTELLRRTEPEYKEFVQRHGEPDDQDAIDWMVIVPKLIERPVVINGNKAKIGRPPESILEIL